MRKPRIYLDTSVVSHLEAQDVPDKMSDTLKFWQQAQEEMYEIYSSYLMLEEISRCSEPKLTSMYKHLNNITFNLIEAISTEAEFIANEIVRLNILTEKRRDDCTHIGLAVANECDIIVSWNFKHMVNVRTINGVRGINAINGYRSIDIYSPTVLLKEHA
ncbi:MAG: PIN domain nuclease [Defluviitaleaceae bacterium]|nr:PIN domain nuclease [Defluviitaleaceae bacterium]